MFNKALLNKEENDTDNNKELTEEDYDQINKEISKALFQMKKEEEENNSDENIDEDEKELDNFDYDFFSNKSNSISNDNFSDISEQSYKSANVEMNRNNSFKINMINNNFETSKNNNNYSGITKDISSSSGDVILNDSSQSKKTPLKSMKNEENNNIINNNKNIENHNNSISSSPYLPNLNNNNNIFIKNYFNESIMNNDNQHINNINIINNINSNHNNNNINNQNSFINTQHLININNLKYFTVNNKYFNNNIPLNNINTVNYNNNCNALNDQFLLNNNKQNFSIFPSFSDKGIPRLYNLDSPKNIINLDNIIKGRDKRTTLIIRNIPNKYTMSLLLDELNKNFENKFDVVYLPHDFINNSNLGFGFISFVNHMHLLLFYEEFVGKKWNCFNSKKRCQLAYSKYQGKTELIKYIHTKLGVSNLDNNNDNIKKSFFCNYNKNIKASIEIPIKYYNIFISFYPYSLCKYKDDKVFVIDKYYNI